MSRGHAAASPSFVAWFSAAVIATLINRPAGNG